MKKISLPGTHEMTSAGIWVHPGELLTCNFDLLRKIIAELEEDLIRGSDSDSVKRWIELAWKYPNHGFYRDDWARVGSFSESGNALLFTKLIKILHQREINELAAA